MYNGKLLMRFDDTNPSKEKVEYVESILSDLKTLGIVPHKISYTSDHFDLILEHGTAILKKGLAYIDKTPPQEMKDMRMSMEESVYRDQPIEENLRLWEEMQKGSEEVRADVLLLFMLLAVDIGKRTPSTYMHHTGPEVLDACED